MDKQARRRLEKQIRRHRAAAIIEQGGLCYYCDRPMWLGGEDALAAYRAEHGLTRKQARLRLATAEHLVPRSEGGASDRANIAAACRYCNTRRHFGKRVLSAELYRAKVQRRLAAGRWN